VKVNVSLPLDSQSKELPKEIEDTDATTSLLGNNDEEAQIDPLYFAPKTERKNSRANRTRTSILFVLFEYAIENGQLKFHFIDQCSTIWRLDIFANASFYSSFRKSVAKWRIRILEDEILRNRLLRQFHNELQRLTYPLPKRSGSSPIRKRGYRDKGSTRPIHQRFRSDKDTVVSVYAQDLQVVQKIVVYGRRPTVTYRRLPFSEEIGRLLELGLLERVGDFIIPSTPKED